MHEGITFVFGNDGKDADIAEAAIFAFDSGGTYAVGTDHYLADFVGSAEACVYGDEQRSLVRGLNEVKPILHVFAVDATIFGAVNESGDVVTRGKAGAYHGTESVAGNGHRAKTDDHRLPLLGIWRGRAEKGSRGGRF